MPQQATSTSPEQQGTAAVDYGAFYYRHDCGVPYERNDHWLGFFAEVADGIVRDLHPISVLDAGCAMGFLVEELRKRGVDASGFDISEYAIENVHESVAEHCRVGSLTEPVGERYDLVTCIEVLEHLPPEESGAAIANLCAASDRILFSSTPEDFGEATHLNVQPPEAWSALMAQHGFHRDLDLDLSYLTPWATLYVRREEPPVETIRRYDRAWFRLRREVAEVRGSLLKAQEEMARLEAGGGATNRPRLLEELDARDQEILKLRDLLIGLDAELGTARGRAAELEAKALSVTNAARKLDARVPLFGKLARRILGLLRGK